MYFALFGEQKILELSKKTEQLIKKAYQDGINAQIENDLKRRNGDQRENLNAGGSDKPLSPSEQRANETRRSILGIK